MSYVRYPPLGQRSFGPTRANFSAGANYAAEANDEILAFAMIETAQAMDEPRRDRRDAGARRHLCRAGRPDLQPRARSPGPGLRPRGAGDDRGAAADRRRLQGGNGIRAALHCGTPDYAARAIGWGFDMTTVGGRRRGFWPRRRPRAWRGFAT